MRVGRQQVVGAHDRRVAPDVASAEPALLQHRDPGDAVVLGEVVGGGEPVSAAADDDHVVGRLRLRRAPHALPLAVAAQGIAEEGKDGVARHGGIPRMKAEVLGRRGGAASRRSEEHTSELQSLMRISYAVFCLKKTRLQCIYTTQHKHTRIMKYNMTTY